MSKTLIEILEEKSKLSSKGITFIESSDNEDFLSYQSLYQNALETLSFLQNRGLCPQDELIFQVDDNKTFVVLFWACIMGGIIPVPLSVGRNDDHRQKLFNVWKILNNPYLIHSSDNLKRLQKHAEKNNESTVYDSIQNKCITIDEVKRVERAPVIYQADEHDIAYIQFSSGSTGSPKGVTLTHKNLITNMMGISEGSLYAENDSKLSWMPLTHDMGLIGFHLCPLFCGMDHFLMPTNLFIRRPGLWLDKASQHKCTILCSPNFGYSYLLKQYNAENEYGWDFSHVKMIYNGAEPISEEICNQFLAAMERHGLAKSAMYPVYGLAEASLAVAFSKLDDEVVSLKIDRTKTHVGETIHVTGGGENSASFVNVGTSIPYCSMQITDDNNGICDEKVIGHICIKGENVTAGYYNNPKATCRAINKDGWLDTGDLGFMYDGCLYVTGRSKDIIFVNGQNYYPHDIERDLEAIDSIELGKVVVAGNTSAATSEEEIIVFALHKGKPEKFIGISGQIKKQINQTFGFEPNHIIPVREIPKTTSGKVQRFKLIEEYTAGRFNEIIQELKTHESLQEHDVHYIEPATDEEQKLAGIWSAALSHDKFGVQQKFFDVGGDSLKGAQIISAIHKEFGVEMDYNLLFEKQTIREIAEEIKQHEIKQYEPISRIAEQDYYPLSSAQKRLYYLWQVEKSSISYNIPVAFSVNGKLNIDKLESAIIQLIERHDILRTSFCLLNGEPMQKISEKIDFDLVLSEANAENIKSELRKRVEPYDLHQLPLFRIELFHTSDEGHVLFLDFHHIICDGLSISLFLDELFAIYRGNALPELEIQYKDYIQWESANINSEKQKKQSQYWLSQFHAEIPVLNLPSDFTRPSLMEYHGEKLEFQIDRALSVSLKNFAKQENTSLFALLLAAYKVLLSKYAGQEDIVAGVPVAGRNHQQLQQLMGMFVNNLAVRSYPKGSLTFKEFLNQVQSISLQALSNQDYPFEKLVEQIGQKRDVSRNSLFDTMFIYQNMEFPSWEKGSVSLEQYFFNPGFAKYDISIEVFDRTDEITYCIEYLTSLFRKDTIQRFARHFENLLHKIVESPNSLLSDLTLTSAEENIAQLEVFNDTGSEYPQDKAIHQLIEEQAKKTPDALAVVMGNASTEERMNSSKQEEGSAEFGSLAQTALERLTYKELNEKSNRLANLLRKRGVAPNIPVALVLERSPELIIAILAVLKAGGCYLPIEKDLPDERIKYILKDSQVNLVITDFPLEGVQDDHQAGLFTGVQLININDAKEYLKEDAAIENINTSRNLAYIIYTSGTTGQPKGVMVEHQSLVNYICFANKTYSQGEKVSYPLYTSTSFDLTVTSIFTPLISGDMIVTYPENEKSLSLENVISDKQVHILKATPSHLKMLKEYRSLMGADCFSRIKRLIVGGEALTTQLADEIHHLFGEGIEIFNEYGPTEATVGCMIYKYDREKDKRQTVPIGVPVDNAKIYLLDKYMRPVPAGVCGDIYISGDCLARGYMFKPELTDEKFVDNPFAPNQKMYKTGDLAKRLADGNIEFVGRDDQQIKLNGYRIEIEEIQQQILACVGVKEAVVAMHKDEILCGYFVKQDAGPGNGENEETEIQNLQSRIRHHLTSCLPHYMHPKILIAVNEIPLTKNGKIDYRLLPAPNENKNKTETATNDIQAAMVAVWQDVLNEKSIGITDNFFELGGDSIKAVQIASSLFDKNISVNVKDILTCQTIDQLFLHAEITDGTSHYDQGVVKGETPPNPIQCWFFDQKFVNPHFYNQSVLLEFKNTINKEILRKTFEILVEHHDGLRMNYNSERNVMFYNDSHLNKRFTVEEYSLAPKGGALGEELGENGSYQGTGPENPFSVFNSPASFKDRDSFEAVLHDMRNSFDVTESLLIKAAVIQGRNADLLFVSMHHLLCDGVSWRVLLEDFHAVYTSLEHGREVGLPKKTASLLDWGRALQEYSKSEELKGQTAYWENNLPSSDVSLSSACSLSPINCVDDIQKTVFRLTEEESRFLLTDANKPYNTNAEILFLSALVHTFREFASQDEIVIEMENHGRQIDGVDAARTVGWFTSLFPLKFKYEDDLADQVKQVKDAVRKVPDKGAGYGILQYITKSLGALNDLPELRFNYLGQFGDELKNDLFAFVPEYSGLYSYGKNHITAKNEINVMLFNNMLQVEINAAGISGNDFADKYRNSIKRMLAHLKEERGVHFSPTDFDAVELDEEDLEALFD